MPVSPSASRRAARDAFRRPTSVALTGVSRRFAHEAADVSDLAELEIDPLMAGADGVLAVQARARA